MLVSIMLSTYGSSLSNMIGKQKSDDKSPSSEVIGLSVSFVQHCKGSFLSFTENKILDKWKEFHASH